MANTIVSPGPDDPKMILRSVPNGLWVTKMGGGHGTCGKDGQGAPVSDGLPTLRIPKGVVVGGLAT